MRVIFDAEFDSLTPTRVWCVVCKDIDTGENHVFRYDKGNFRGFIRFAKDVTLWIGLNSLTFDGPHLSYLIGDGFSVPNDRHLDLLIVSRLVWQARPGGHSVAAWGKRFGLVKPEIKVYDDPNMIEDYIDRCIHDVEIQHRIYLDLLRHITNPEFKRAIDMEHRMELVCMDMNENGFSFDKDKAEDFLHLVIKEMAGLEAQMKATIPLRLVLETSITLRRNKDGRPSKKTTEEIGGANFLSDTTWERFHYEQFSPGSAKQRVELLNASGWKPIEKTKTHIQIERALRFAKWKRKQDIPALEKKLERFKTYGWKVSEKNLDTLPATAPVGARLLATWLSLEGRRADLVEWLSAYNVNSGRIHGRFNPLGSWTHRMSHSNPNQGNIFREFYPDQCQVRGEPTPVEDVKLRFNGVLRGLWRAEPGAYLLGCDAEGIQMRVLAHYIGDEGYTRSIVEGKKEDKTDVHNVNMQLLGPVCLSRDDSKTFIYAWLLGASVGMVSHILKCTTRQASVAIQLFVKGIPGLAALKEVDIPRDARRGYFVGFDGRKVIVPSEHHVLAGYLQNGESLVMKYANLLWREWADKEGIWYKQVDLVHDEYQTEFYRVEDGPRLGELQCKAITQAGIDLGVRCHLAGDYDIGRNWRETH